VLLAGRFGFRILVEAREFSLLFKNFQIVSGQFPSQWAPGFFPWVERPGCEFDHSLPSSIDVKNEWRYMPVPPICMCGVEGEIFAFFTFTGNKSPILII